MLIGYARVSTDAQDLTAQRDALDRLGVKPGRVHVDHDLTETNRARPGLREAPAGCCPGDTLVVTKLDRLARSLPDARATADELTASEVRLSLGGAEELLSVTRSTVYRAVRGQTQMPMPVRSS